MRRNSSIMEPIFLQQDSKAFEKSTFSDKVKKITLAVHKNLNEKPILLICIIGASITRLLAVLFSTYLILWIQKYADEGIIESSNVGKEIYMEIMLISVGFSTILFPFIGYICDKMDPAKIVPGAFLMRCASTCMFCMLDRPDTFEAYLVCVLMIIATIIENISVDSIFNKNLPKESRGALNGLFSFAGQSGILFYSIIGGWMFDKIGRFSPFVVIGICDFSFAILCLIHGLKTETTEEPKTKAKNVKS